MDSGNHRPVSALPIMSKVFEKEITNKITLQFDKLFHPSVSDFRNGIDKYG